MLFRSWRWTTRDVVLLHARLPVYVDGHVFTTCDVKSGPRFWWFPSARRALRKLKTRIGVLVILVEMEVLHLRDLNDAWIAQFLEDGDEKRIRSMLACSRMAGATKETASLPLAA